MKHFAIEREGSFLGDGVLLDNNGNVAFQDLMRMNYDEMKSYDRIEEFVVSVMDAANARSDVFDGQTIVTLVGDDDVFIWSVIIGVKDDGDFNYAFVDWKKDGKTYKYLEEN